MAETLEFELVSPAKLLVSEAAEMVVVPGIEGNFGAMPRHAPMLSTVRPGVIDIYNDGKITKSIFVAGGFAEVTEERCTVLAEEALAVEELTEAFVNGRLQEAKDQIQEADTALDQALAEKRLKIAEAMAAAR